VQILTVEELLAGKRAEYPYFDDVTFRKAGKVEDEGEEHPELF